MSLLKLQALYFVWSYREKHPAKNTYYRMIILLFPNNLTKDQQVCWFYTLHK